MGYSRQDYGDYGAESQGNSCYKTPLGATYLECLWKGGDMSVDNRHRLRCDFGVGIEHVN